MTKVLCAATILMLASCGSRASGNAAAPSFHRVQQDRYCTGMALYERPDVDSFIGRMITEGELDGVRAIDVSMLVDGGERSVWRRESEILKWYALDGEFDRDPCLWRPRTSPVKPGNLEYGLDVKLVRRGRGWTTAQP